VLFFRYRHSAFDLIPPAFHTRVTSGAGTLARYHTHATILNVDSVTCSDGLAARPAGLAAQPL
jgi:hypothetical protein